MNRRIWSTVISAIFLIASSACSKNRAAPQVIREIPSGFTGNFLLEMGVRDALPLEKRGSIGAARAQEREGHHVDSADQLPAIIPEFQRRCCVGLFALGFLPRTTEYLWAPRSNFLLAPEMSTRRNRAGRNTRADF
jgi:hypothetical protein